MKLRLKNTFYTYWENINAKYLPPYLSYNQLYV